MTSDHDTTTSSWMSNRELVVHRAMMRFYLDLYTKRRRTALAFHRISVGLLSDG